MAEKLSRDYRLNGLIKMIIKCEHCSKFYDDQFRSTVCPHDTFSANDGQNNFRHYPESWLADKEPSRESHGDKFNIMASEFDLYQQWLNENKIKTEEIK